MRERFSFARLGVRHVHVMLPRTYVALDEHSVLAPSHAVSTEQYSRLFQQADLLAPPPATDMDLYSGYVRSGGPPGLPPLPCEV